MHFVYILIVKIDNGLDEKSVEQRKNILMFRKYIQMVDIFEAWTNFGFL